MLTSHRRPLIGSRSLTTSLALAAAVTLAAAPVAAAQSTVEADGTIAVSSLGSTTGTPGSLAGSLGSLASPAYAEYVALGDSYAAFGDQTELVVTDGPAAPCRRSLTNYPNALDANPAVGDLTDVTCGGAITTDVLSKAQHTGVAPQVETLNEDTDLVTLSIGGNDVGFGEIVECIAGGAPGAPLDCEDELGEQVGTAIADIFGEGGAVDEIYDEIEERSPNATVIATQYMPLMPADDEDGCPFTQFIGVENLNWARQITADINNAVTEAAQRNDHVSVLPTSDTDRSGCASAEQRWTDFAGGEPTNAFPMHPTALGQQAMAAAIAAVI